MSTFASYIVVNCQSGALEYCSRDGPDDRATCITQANAISLTKPNHQMAVVPVGYPSESARPLLDAVALAALASNVRRQPVLTDYT